MNTLVLIALLVLLGVIAYALPGIALAIGRVADAIEKERAKISDQPTVDLDPRELLAKPEPQEHVEPLEERKPRPIRL